MLTNIDLIDKNQLLNYQVELQRKEILHLQEEDLLLRKELEMSKKYGKEGKDVWSSCSGCASVMFNCLHLRFISYYSMY